MGAFTVVGLNCRIQVVCALALAWCTTGLVGCSAETTSEREIAARADRRPAGNTPMASPAAQASPYPDAAKANERPLDFPVSGRPPAEHAATAMAVPVPPRTQATVAPPSVQAAIPMPIQRMEAQVSSSPLSGTTPLTEALGFGRASVEGTPAMLRIDTSAAPPQSAPSGPVWNAWMEPSAQSYQPAQTLKPGENYRIRVHLSGQSYGKAEGGLASGPIGDAMRKYLDDLPPGTVSTDLDALLIYDSSYFEDPPDGNWQPIKVNVLKLKSFLSAAAPAGAGDPLTALRQNPAERPFVFGDAEFTLRAKIKADLPSPARLGSVAISIWDRAKNIPIDEISFAVCVEGADCSGARPTHFGFDGFDGIRANLGAKDALPVLSVHLVQLKNGKLHGVLKDNFKDGYKSWPLDKYSEISTVVQNHITDLWKFGDIQRIRNGAGLLEDLFPTTSEVSRAANQAFIEAVLPYMKGDSYPSTKLPVIFFRIAAADAPGIALWPLSLIAVSEGAMDQGRHLGRYFQIESPLKKQNYDDGNDCISDWVIVGPGKQGLFESARSQISRITLGDDSQPSLSVGGTPVPIIEDMPHFMEYLWGPSQFEIPHSERPIILSMISHHDRDRVYFDEDAIMVSSQVRRTFKSPSIALLQGCDTGKPGATGFIASLNARGIHAAVATIQEIEAKMAGDYLDCFLEQFDGDSDAGVPIGTLHTGALKCLEARPANWGSKALFFSLVGNSGLKVCKPKTQN